MNALKLNQLEKNTLSEKEMNNLNGGNDRACLCGCKGSSSTEANGEANVQIGDYGGYSPDVPYNEQDFFWE
ncbi:MAG: TIGR04149 family rSAM-modified RiPP [Bacteroidales bacterium]